jgi:hypothetical protein
MTRSLKRTSKPKKSKTTGGNDIGSIFVFDEIAEPKPKIHRSIFTRLRIIKDVWRHKK